MAGRITVLCAPRCRVASRRQSTHLVSPPAPVACQRRRLSAIRRGRRHALGSHAGYGAAAAHRLWIGNSRRASVGPAHRVIPVVPGHDRRPRIRTANSPQRLLGTAGLALVRSNGSRHAVRRRDGNSLVPDHCHRQRRADYSTHLYPRGPQHGFDRIAHVDTRRLAGGSSISFKRHETGLGLRLALTHGGGNLS